MDFIDFVVNKTIEKTDEWLKCLSCPTIYIDGTNPIDEIICTGYESGD